MRRSRRLLGTLGLALYAVATVLLPAAHLAHHKDDHTHGAGDALIFLGATDGAADLGHGDASQTVDTEHQAFDADLVELGLSDAAHFGVSQVDCSLADYTLSDCAAGTAASHSFGDELAARLPHHHHHSDSDQGRHGEHSLAHFGLAFLSWAPVLLPPPAESLALPPAPPVEERPASRFVLAPNARGPPRLT